VYYVCRQAVWREDLATEGIQWRYFQGRFQFGRKVRGSSPLELYRGTVSEYNIRKLTFPHDIVNAFMALQNCLLKLFQGSRNFYGLLSGVFDKHILWSELYGRSKRGIKRRHIIPSWSWMGWEGCLTFTCSTTSDTTFDTTSDIQWLTTETWIDWYIVEGEQLIPIWDPV
jgi:hypothetical protein